MGTLIKSNANVFKYFPFGKEYPILDVKVGVGYDQRVKINVLVNDDRGKNQWKSLSRFIGYASF